MIENKYELLKLFLVQYTFRTKRPLMHETYMYILSTKNYIYSIKWTINTHWYLVFSKEPHYILFQYQHILQITTLVHMFLHSNHPSYFDFLLSILPICLNCSSIYSHPKIKEHLEFLSSVHLYMQQETTEDYKSYI